MESAWESHLFERKTDRDLKDIRRTVVAFANSVRPGETATILIGESNDGVVSGVVNPDDMQRKLRESLLEIYPSVVWRLRLEEKSGKTCVRIKIDYSGDTPHFAGAAWVRRGSESVKATDEQLQFLVDVRSGKVRTLSQWINKEISLSIHAPGGIKPNFGRMPAKLLVANADFCTFETSGNMMGRRSEPVAWLTLGWDDQFSRLRVYVDPDRSTL